MTGPRYDLAINPPYQINYRAKRAGKHVSATKRRVTFQFGFSSARAIAAGREGIECRGEEHEVVLVWSHITGKRQLFMNGRECHMSKAARGNTKFEHSWGIAGGHILKIHAHCTPATERTSYARQFDLELDGMSFFQFAKIYELGQGGGRASSAPAVGYSYRGAAYDARDDDEDEEVAQAPVSEVQVASTVDLFDAQPTSLISPVTNYSSKDLPSLASSNTSSSASYSYDEFTPVECQTQKTFDSISSDILGAYGNNVPAPAPSATENQSSSRALVPVSEDNMDAITKSMKSLVNLDDITTGPVKPLAAPTSATQQKKALQSWDLVGRQPTLAEMRDSVRSQSPTMPAQVMKPQPQMAYGQPQAMVAYQQGATQAAAPQYGYSYGYGAPNAGYAPAY